MVTPRALTVWIVLFKISSPSSRVPRVLRLPVCSTIGPKLLRLSANRGYSVGEESSASFSSAEWGRAPQNSLKALTSTQTVSVKFWMFLVRISIYVGFIVLVHRAYVGLAKCFENRSGQGSLRPGCPS
ncbi:hypothetical protein TIFTF001_032562 [Ficus carica]|uniref:Uncharacterized protein n=1 Tax=Ficus carica TaxID=3494 RepID=A0AA88DXP3_FICCA|nr:hypothetical protein TIFTF001_032562 [Ficus carica]